MTGIRRILLTGGHGFIGSHLTRALLREGYEVGLLRRETSDLSRVREYGSRIFHYPADLRDPASVQGAVEAARPDAIVHLAMYYAVEHHPEELGVMMDTNVKGAIALLDACQDRRLSLFLNTSTCAVYREKNEPLKETDPVSPQNLYALTKLQAEDACRFYNERLGVPTATLRLFPPYGPGDNERRLLPYTIRSLLEGQDIKLTTGLQEWDFVYVDDIVAAFLAALSKPEKAVEAGVLNVGTGYPHSVREVVSKVHEMTGSKGNLLWGAVEHRKNEVWYNSGSFRRIQSVLGWEPRYTLDEGLLRTIGWFRDHPGSGKG